MNRRIKRTPEQVAQDDHIYSLIALWRGRNVSYKEISRRLAEKGFQISDDKARKIYSVSQKK